MNKEYFNELLKAFDESYREQLFEKCKEALRAGITNIRIEQPKEGGLWKYHLKGTFRNKRVTICQFERELVDIVVNEANGITLTELASELNTIPTETIEYYLDSLECKTIKIHRVMDQAAGYPWITLYFTCGTPIQF